MMVQSKLSHNVLQYRARLISVVFVALVGSRIVQRSPAAADGANILAVEPIGSVSHWKFMTGILRALVDGGHNVTVFTPFVGGDRKNYTEVDISDGLWKTLNNDIDITIDMWYSSMRVMDMILELSRHMCDKIYADDRMREVLDSARTGRFDLVIVEPYNSDCVSYLATTLKLPQIYVTGSPFVGFMERTVTGHLSNPATVSNILAGHAVPKTFAQRLSNTAMLAYCVVIKVYKELIWKYTEPREYDSIASGPASLVFVNRHFISSDPNPVPSNVINVGGIHLREPEGLPKDILEFIEQSTHGVIFFTFGSTLKMSSLPEHIKKIFMKALSSIPQRVLWKYEDEMADKPNNFMIKKWLPQRDILLHPNVKLFISHGGVAGFYEAVDAGIPVLGFPVVYDQIRNIDCLVNAGMAISMDLMSVSEDELLKNVLELVQNEKYAKNAKTVSNVFKDRPMSPSESVVYWTEYVLRHKGAPHLKSHSFNLMWYQHYLLDVLAFVLICIFSVLFVTYKIMRTIRKRVLIIQSSNARSKIE